MRLRERCGTGVLCLRDVCPLVMLIAAFCWPQAASAEPIPVTVTSGSTFLYWDFSRSSFQFTGEGFLMGGEHHGGVPLGWAVGSTTTLSGSFEPLVPGGDEDGLSSVVVDDVAYNAFLVGTITLTSEAFVVPPLASGASQVFSVPFTASGRIQGYAQPSDLSTLLFDIDLRGIGTATATGTGVSDGSFLLTQGTQYVFEDPAAPVPEPGTMLLIGSGLAGFAAVRRRRAKPFGED
jgi:hypothetical protein